MEATALSFHKSSLSILMIDVVYFERSHAPVYRSVLSAFAKIR